jgi:hypothetical protein
MAEQESKERDRELAFSAAKILYDLFSVCDGNIFKSTASRRAALAKIEARLREAAELGHLQAQLALGKLLLAMSKNATEAFAVIQRAAEHGGESEARLILGMLLAFGDGCERDEKEARRWLLRWCCFARFADVDEVLKVAATVCTVERKADKDDVVGSDDGKGRAFCYLTALDAQQKAEVKRKRLDRFFNMTDLFNFDSSVCSEQEIVLSSSDQQMFDSLRSLLTGKP